MIMKTVTLQGKNTNYTNKSQPKLSAHSIENSLYWKNESEGKGYRGANPNGKAHCCSEACTHSPYKSVFDNCGSLVGK
jgi:hypothetical protein